MTPQTRDLQKTIDLQGQPGEPVQGYSHESTPTGEVLLTKRTSFAGKKRGQWLPESGSDGGWVRGLPPEIEIWQTGTAG